MNIEQQQQHKKWLCIIDFIDIGRDRAKGGKGEGERRDRFNNRDKVECSQGEKQHRTSAKGSKKGPNEGTEKEDCQDHMPVCVYLLDMQSNRTVLLILLIDRTRA